MAFGVATPIAADPFGTGNTTDPNAPKTPSVQRFMQGNQDNFNSMPAPNLPDRMGGQGDPSSLNTTVPLGGGASPDMNNSKAAPNQGNTQSAIQAPGIRPANADELGLTGDPIAKMGQAANNLADVQYQNTLKARQSSLNGLGMNVPDDGSSVGGLDGEQSSNARAIMAAGKARGMSDGDIQTAIMTSLAESGLRNLNGGDRDSLGLFQQRPSQGWGTPQQVTDPTYAANKFYDGLAGAQGATPWARAQAVQRSAFADGSNYQAQYAKSQQIMQSLNEGARSAPKLTGNGSASWITSNANKYLDYDGQYGAQCVDLYDFYTTGFVGGQAPMVGYANEIWNNYDQKAYARVANNQVPQMGDVAVWGKGGSTPMSHVGIIIQDLGNGYVKTLSNNATSQGNKGTSAVVTLSKSALMGYLRPRKLM